MHETQEFGAVYQFEQFNSLYGYKKPLRLTYICIGPCLYLKQFKQKRSL